MRKPSASMVVAVVALVMATTGTGIAATHYVISSSSQVKNGALSASDLSRSARKSLAGATGARGATGATGAAGAAGAAGRDGVKGNDGAAGPAGQTGARGPSDAFAVTGLGSANSVPLPPGQYVVVGHVYLGATTTTQPSCTVLHGGSGRISFGSAAVGQQFTQSVSDTFTITDSEPLSVTCSGYNTSVATTARVTAIQVGAVHTLLAP